MNEAENIATQVAALEIPLEHDLFMRTLIRELANVLQDVVGTDQAAGFISVVGQVMGNQINDQYCKALEVTSLSAGSRYFCESFYGHPCPTSGKNYATAYAFGGPSRPASLVAYPTRGMQHSYRNDSTRFRKACIFTTRCSVKTHALSLLGTTRLLSRSERSFTIYVAVLTVYN